MYAGLRLAKTFVCCCPDQLNKCLANSKIESVRRLLCSVRAKSTFVVASSQSQRVAFMTRSATVTFYLYEDLMLGPGREDLSGQWSVWCSCLLNLPENYAVDL